MPARRPPTPTHAPLSQAAVALGALLLLVPPARGQDLAELYRAARFDAQAERILAEQGPYAEALPPERLPLPPGLALPGRTSGEGEADVPLALPAYEVRRSQFVRKLQRLWFRRTFGGTKWSYLGSHGLTPLDTTRTRELRARLQAAFGQPTQTLAEQNPRRTMTSESPVQFEYWFVLNDSIPLVVTDTNGPYERGLIVSTDSRYRELLPAMREAFLGAIMEVERLVPYVDYYYDREERAWYRTGFDGRTYFHQPIRRPNLARGRPWIEGQSAGGP